MSVTVITRSQSSSVMSKMVLLSEIATLLTRMSTWPKRPTTAFTMRGDVGAFRHVGGEQLGVAAGCLDRVDGALAARLVEVDDRDLGAFGGEQLGDLLADIAAGAGDDRDLILELHVVIPATSVSDARHYMARQAGRQERAPLARPAGHDRNARTTP